MSSELLRVYHQHIGDQIRVHAVGEVDLATVSQLSQALGEATAVPGVRSVVVNLTKVGFFSAVGLTALLVATRHGADTGVPVVVVAHPGQPAHRAITMAELTGALALVDPPDRVGTQRRRVNGSVKTAGGNQLSRDRAQPAAPGRG
ncbi:MAG: STAS domain-containing protein [Pseudonocardiaceae bacterium]